MIHAFWFTSLLCCIAQQFIPEVSFANTADTNIQEIITRLQSKDSSVYYSVEDSLVIEGKNSLWTLKRIVDDDSVNYVARSRALYTLSRIGEDITPIIPSLQRILETDFNRTLWTPALTVVCKLGPDACEMRATLHSLFHRSERTIPDQKLIMAAASLGACGGPLVNDLWQLFGRTSDRRMRWEVESAIVAIGDSAVPYLVNTCQEHLEDEHLLQYVGAILSRIESDSDLGRALYADIAFDTTRNSRTRATFIQLLGIQKDMDGKIAIGMTNILKGQDRELQEQASNALAKHYQIATPLLVSIIRDWEIDTSSAIAAIKALGKMGEKVDAEGVATLCDLLERQASTLEYVKGREYGFWRDNADWGLCDAIVSSLGGIGLKAGDCLPVIWRIRRISISNIRETVLKSILNIAEAQQQARDYSDVALLHAYSDTLSAEMDIYAEIFPYTNSMAENRKAIKRLHLTVDALETLRVNDQPPYVPLLNFISSHTKLAIALLIVLVYFSFFGPICLLLLWIRPSWLFRLFAWMDTEESRFQKVRLVGTIFLFLGQRYLFSKRVLRAEFTNELLIDRVKKTFEDKGTASERLQYIQVPILINGISESELTVNRLRSLFDPDPTVLFVRGEGGIGKTSLLCHIARTSMALTSNKRTVSDHCLIPVLIEAKHLPDSGKVELAALVKRELENLTGRVSKISLLMTRKLSEHGLVLILLDGISELPKVARMALLPNNSSIALRRVVYSGRQLFEMDGMTTGIIDPQKIPAQRLFGFIEEYLVAHGQRNKFSTSDLFDICGKFVGITGERPMTPGVVTLFAAMLSNLDKLPLVSQLLTSIPRIVLTYTNQVYRNIETESVMIAELSRAIKLVAWLCIRNGFQLKAINISTIRDEFASNGIEVTVLNSLLKARGPVGLNRLERDRVVFTDDFVAEYLAAFYLVDLYGSDVQQWLEFFKSIEQTAASESHAKAFLSACFTVIRAEEFGNNVPQEIISRFETNLGTSERQPLQNENLSDEVMLSHIKFLEAGAQATFLKSLLIRSNVSRKAIESVIPNLTHSEYVIRNASAELLIKEAKAEWLPHNSLIDLLSSRSTPKAAKVQIAEVIGSKLTISRPDLNKILPLAFSSDLDDRIAFVKAAKQLVPEVQEEAVTTLRKLIKDARSSMVVEALRTVSMYSEINSDDAAALRKVLIESQPSIFRFSLTREGDLQYAWTYTDSSGGKYPMTIAETLQNASGTIVDGLCSDALDTRLSESARSKIILILIGMKASEKLTSTFLELLRDSNESIRSAAAVWLAGNDTGRKDVLSAIDALSDSEIPNVSELKRKLFERKE